MSQNPNAKDILTWERIHALPIADDTMTTDQLRRLCTDTFRLQLTFAWTPKEDLSFQRTQKFTHLKKGSVYGGIPYAIGGLGNLYRWMEINDEKTGMVTIPKDLPREFKKIFANQCSFGAFWAWSRVSNSLMYKLTNDIMERCGCIPIGEYDYDRSLTDFADYTTTRICEENGRQTMFRSYAVMQEADGIVNFTTGGHVRMISSAPVVVKNEDGTINGEESYTTFLDQAAKYHTMQMSDGSDYEVQGGVDTKISFAKLFDGGYLPFTIPEFCGKSRVDKAYVTLEKESDALEKAILRSNYPISHIILHAEDKEGNEICRSVFYPLRGVGHFARFEQELSFLAEQKEFQIAVEKGLIFTLSAFVGSGEQLIAYRGIPGCAE